MPLQFTKMHGLGNDFILIDAFQQTIDHPAELAVALCDRRRGVGADGVILVGPADASGADLRMRIFNADGSIAEMCGNGIRCAAKLAYERGWARENPLHFQTDAGLRIVELTLDGAERVVAARVDMGAPILEPRGIPVHHSGERALELEIVLPDATLTGAAVSMGNPHVVIYCDNLDRVPLESWGPRIERDPSFPHGVNVQFAQVLSRRRVRMKTWERGVGATPACGTGASAVCVAGVLRGLTERKITTELPGGELDVHWDETSGRVFMTGPAEETFQGTITLRP